MMIHLTKTDTITSEIQLIKIDKEEEGNTMRSSMKSYSLVWLLEGSYCHAFYFVHALLQGIIVEGEDKCEEII